MMSPAYASVPSSTDDQKNAALGYITEAWIEAVKDGLDPECVAEAALEAAVRELVALRGEARVTSLIETLGPRVGRGEFSTHVTRQ
jgi:hypothetical protein